MIAANDLDSFIRPSAMKRLDAENGGCAGAARMEAAVTRCVPTLDEITSTAEANTGTLGHRLVSIILSAIFYDALGEPRATPANAAETIERVRQHSPDAKEVDGWTWRCVCDCVRFALALVEKHMVKPDGVLTEHWLDGSPFGITRGGTADLVLVVPFRLVILVDWKLGFLQQDSAEEHDQAATYAVMAAASFQAQDVLVYLYVPRVEESARATAAAFDARTLRATADWSRRVAAAARDPDAELSPSWRACEHCRALPFCPAAKDAIVKAREALEANIVPTTPEDWGKLTATAKIAGKFSDKGIDLAKAELAAGRKVAGWEIGPPTVERVIPNARDAFLLLREVPALEMAFWSAAKVSRNELDKQCGSARDKYAHLLVEKAKAGSLREAKGAKATA